MESQIKQRYTTTSSIVAQSDETKHVHTALLKRETTGKTEVQTDKSTRPGMEAYPRHTRYASHNVCQEQQTHQSTRTTGEEEEEVFGSTGTST